MRNHYFAALLGFLCLLFYGFAQAQTTYFIGNGTQTNTTYSYPSPFGNYYSGAKEQYLIRASELSSAGISGATNLSALAFNVLDASGVNAFTGYQVKLAMVSDTSLSDFVHPAFTTVFYRVSYTAYTGWNDLNFDTPFHYDGSSNLLVEVCYNNDYSSTNAQVYYSNTSQQMTASATTWGSGICAASSTNQLYYSRPNMRFTGSAAPTHDLGIIQWSSPQSGTTPNSNQAITVQVKNFGTQSQSSFQLAYSIDGGTTIVSETVSSAIAAGDTLTYTFSQTADMSAQQLYPSGAAVTLVGDTLNYNDSLFTSIYMCSSLSGSYTIGAGSTDFASINDAVNALQSCGVSGPVTFNLQTGTYNEQIDLTYVSGMSATQTVTFQSASSNPDDVKWEYNTSDASANHILRISSASYFIIKNISFQPLDDYSYRAIHITNGSSNILIDGCAFSLPTTNYSTHAAVEISDGASGHYNTIRNCSFFGGETGVRADGDNSANQSIHTRILNNSFAEMNNNAIHIENQDSCLIEGNTIDVKSATGIYGNYLSNGFRINANKIRLQPSSGANGIYLSSCNSTNNFSPGWVSNNMIHYESGSNQYGVYMYANYNTYVVYNSIHIETGNSFSKCIYQTYGGTTRIINNNLSTRAGVAMDLNQSATDSVWNNNLYTYGNDPLAMWNGSSYANIVAFDTADAGIQNNISTDPGFYASDDLHTNATLLNAGGRVVYGVSTDFDGESRNASTPDIGADEFTPANYDLRILSLGSNYEPCNLSGSTIISVYVVNQGVLDLSSIPLKYRLNKGTYVSESFASTLLAGDTALYTFSSTADFSAAGFYELEVLCDLASEQIRSNDTLVKEVFKVDPITLPLTYDFEDTTQHYFYPVLQSQTNAYYITDNHINGTRAVQMEGGKYNGWNYFGSAFTEVVNQNQDHLVQAQSCTIDASSHSALRLSFDLHQQNSGSSNYNWFYLKINGTDYAKSIQGDSVFRATDNNSEDRKLEYDLSAYAGSTIQLSFEAYLYLSAEENYGNGDRVQLDNIRMWEPLATDVGISNIFSRDISCGDVNDSIFLEIKNYGYNAVSNVPYYATATTPLGVTVFQDTFTGSIPAFGSVALFAGHMNTVFNGPITGYTHTYLSGDQEGANDTLPLDFQQETYFAQSYTEGFENGDDQWSSNGFMNQDGSYFGSSGTWKMADVTPYMAPSSTLGSASSDYTLASRIPFYTVSSASYLSFDYLFGSPLGSNDSIAVFVSDDCGTSWYKAYVLTNSNYNAFPTNNDGSHKFSVPVGSYGGSKLRVAISCFSDYTNSYQFMVDNIGMLEGLSVALGNDTSICDGDTLSLSTSYTGSAYSFKWTDLQGNLLSTAETFKVYTSGDYICEVSSSTHLPGYDTINVQIHPGFGAYFHTTDFSLCEGESKLGQVQLNGVPPFSIDVFDGSTTHTHTAHNFFFDTLLTPTVNTGYILTNMIDGNGCVFSEVIDSIHATVHSLPSVSVDNLDPGYCVSDTLITLSGTPSGGTFSGLAISNGDFTPNASHIGGQMITYSYTDANGCTADTLVQTYVNPLPMVAITNAPSGDYCQNGNVLDLIGFPSGGSFSNPQGTNGLFDPMLSSPGTHQIVYSYTDVNSCVNADTVDISIVAPAPVSISTSLNASYCSNEAAINLSATPAGGTFSGNGVAGNVFDPSLAAPGSVDIIYQATDANGCIQSDTLQTFVYTQPTVLIMSQVQSDYCENDASISLSGYPSGGSFTGTGVASNSFDPASAGSGSHKILYTYTDANGCINKDSVSTQVHSLPTVQVGILPDLCENGASSLLSGGTPAGGSYSGNGINSATNTIAPLMLSPGLSEVVYHYTDAMGCENSDTSMIRVVGTPQAGFSLPAASCAGDSVDIAFNGIVSTSTIFNWDFDNALIHSGSLAGPYSVKWDTAGVKVLTLSVSDSGCTSALQTQIISIQEGFAQITAAGNTQLCYGDSVVLFANASPGNTYQWYLDGAELTHASTSFLSATSSGNYYCEVIDGAGCKAHSDSILVDINAELSSDFTLPTFACINDMVNVQYNGSASPTATYTWDFDGATIASGNQSGPYNLIWNTDSMKTISLVVSEGACSSVLTTHNIDIIGTPASITTLGSTSFCNGGSVVLYANSGAYTYQWKKDGTAISSATNAFYTADQSGMYTVEVSDPTTSCSGISDTVSVSVHSDQFNLAFVADQTQINIPPFLVNFTNQTPNANDYYWAWAFGDGNTSTVKDPSHQYAFDGDYDVILIAQHIQTGCIDTLVKSNYIQCSGGSPNPCNLVASVSVNGSSTLCPGDSVLLLAASNPGATYQWLRDGVLLQGATDTLLWAYQSGAYQVMVSDTACSEFSTPTLISTHSVITPVIMANGQIVPCTNDSMELLVPTYFNAYEWSTGATSQNIFIQHSGDYVVSVTDANGCVTASQPYVVNASLLNKPDICIVGVDSASGHNRIVWERQNNPLIDSFKVYRESTVAGVYDLIATQAYSAQALVIDPNSNPMQRAYRYRISAVDTCGAESPMSTYHKTIHLSINAGLNNSWNLIWDGYVGFNFGSYRIYRGIDSTQMTLLTQIQSTLSSYTDLNPPAGKVYYQIEVVAPHACYPDSLYTKAQTNYNTSRSNVTNTSLAFGTGLPDAIAGNFDLRVYPNPNDGRFSYEIQSPIGSHYTVELLNLTGQRIYMEKGVKVLGRKTNLLDVDHVGKGVYYLRVSNEQQQRVQKIIIN